jgi:LysM repeat protein
MSFQDLDFKSGHAHLQWPQNSVSATSAFHVKVPLKLLLVATVVMLLGFSVSNWPPSAKAADSTLKLARLHYSLPLPEVSESLEQETAEPTVEVETGPWESVTIKSGDTLASIFAKKGIASTTTHQIAKLNEQTKKLRYIKPGQEIHVLLDDEGKLRQMKYIPDITRTLLIQRTEDQSYTSQIINYQLDPYPVYREGEIENSLFEAAANANIPEDVIMDLAAIFGWDIDFSLDIRKGDRFGIVYEELYKDDVKIRNGRILSAEFINNGKTYSAVSTTPTQPAKAIISARMVKACARLSCAARLIFAALARALATSAGTRCYPSGAHTKASIMPPNAVPRCVLPVTARLSSPARKVVTAALW